MKNIIINVDDLGLDLAINLAVLKLAEKKRIQATSFMSLGEIAVEHVQALNTLNIDIGLHLDFTGFAKQGSLKKILAQSYLTQLSSQYLKDIIENQLDLFEYKIGKIPDFIDGHQHVHQFPCIRDVLFECIEQRYSIKIPLRNTMTYQKEIKAKIIYTLGGAAFKKQLQQRHWPHNFSFAGIYNFKTNLLDLQQKWDAWLKNAPDNTVIMCHPAQINSQWTDKIYKARVLEYEWLLSDAFDALWNKYACTAQHWGNLV